MTRSPISLREIVGNMDIGFGLPVSGAWAHLREHRKAEGRSAGAAPA